MLQPIDFDKTVSALEEAIREFARGEEFLETLPPHLRQRYLNLTRGLSRLQERVLNFEAALRKKG